MTEAKQPAQQQPLLRVVNADATPEEVAAIVAVFSAMGGDAPAPPRARSVWADPARRMRRPIQHGRGAWRASAL